MAGNPECVAIGECGLDYNRNFSEPEEQRIVFRKQVSVLRIFILNAFFFLMKFRLIWHAN